MNTNFKSMLMAMHALDPRINPVTGMIQEVPKPAKPKIEWGLDDVEDEYTFPAEQFGLTFRVFFLRDPILVDRITIERLGQSVDLPLCMFDGKHLDDIADEITAALRERGEQRRLDRGEYELARSRDRRFE